MTPPLSQLLVIKKNIESHGRLLFLKRSQGYNKRIYSIHCIIKDRLSVKRSIILSPPLKCVRYLSTRVGGLAVINHMNIHEIYLVWCSLENTFVGPGNYHFKYTNSIYIGGVGRGVALGIPELKQIEGEWEDR